MEESLKQESEKLARSWSQHDATMLRDYLVAGVEDPRVNVQSILARHFLLAAMFGEKFRELMNHELRFAAAMNWLLKWVKPSSDVEEVRAVRHALKRGADNAEGTEIPHFLVQAFASLPMNLPFGAVGTRSTASLPGSSPQGASIESWTLPTTAGGLAIPNYIEEFLVATEAQDAQPNLNDSCLNTFISLWGRTLAGESPLHLTVLEPACGSANDYRFLEACGLARLIDYAGFDLCEKNVANARTMFPRARFEGGNVFEITAPDKAFDCCMVHDLLEHLSPEGIAAAVKEICRVTRHGLCVGFFNMEEIAEHIVRPVNEYHWNTLSMERMIELFAQHGFAAQVFNIETYLRWCTGCEESHNPNAYTFVLGSRQVTV